MPQGLYPESHGIVDNKMYDVRFRRQYRLGSPETSKAEWYGGEPVRSASFCRLLASLVLTVLYRLLS